MKRRKAKAYWSPSVDKHVRHKPLSIAKQMKAYNILYQKEINEMETIGNAIRSAGRAKRKNPEP